MGLRSRPTGLP